MFGGCFEQDMTSCWVQIRRRLEAEWEQIRTGWEQVGKKWYTSFFAKEPNFVSGSFEIHSPPPLL